MSRAVYCCRQRILCAIWMILTPCALLDAQERLSVPGESTGDYRDKIDTLVRARMDTATQIHVLILGRTQLFAPVGGLTRFAAANDGADRRDLRPRVVRTLKSIATREQPGVLRALGNPAATRFWVVNAIAAQLTPEQIRRAAAVPEVAHVYPAGPVLSTSTDTTRLRAELKPPSRRAALSTTGKNIAWYLERLGVTRAWSESKATGEGVVIAAIDNGVSYIHSDLRDNMWVNAREIPANGSDDDNNGYVDDYYGYDFMARRPEVGIFEGPPGAMHGTITSGILVGDGSSGTMTGVAPRARLMMLRGIPIVGALQAFQYAIEHGADVLSMSFAIPNLGDLRGVWRMMSEHTVAAGVVLAGGAGNFRQNRQIPSQHLTPKDVPVVISVGGVDSSLTLAPFSSLGPAEWGSVRFYEDYRMPEGVIKPDLVAFPGPGYPILVVPQGYGEGASGNSFAGPQAAGVAALMLSVAPSLPAWRIKEILEETAHDLGAAGRDNEYGAGIIDAAAAVRAAIADRHRRTRVPQTTSR